MTIKNAAATYKRLIPFIDAVERTPDKHFRFTAEGFEPLSIENLGYTQNGAPVYSMMHSYIQCGDLMRDPDTTFSVDRECGQIIPLSFQQSAPPMYLEVFQGNKYNPSLLRDLDSFLAQWSKNLYHQGFDPQQAAQAQNKADSEITLEAFAQAITGNAVESF